MVGSIAQIVSDIVDAAACDCACRRRSPDASS